MNEPAEKMQALRAPTEGRPRHPGLCWPAMSECVEASIAHWLSCPTAQVRRKLEVWPDGALVVAQNLVDGPMHRAFGATVKLALGGRIRIETAGGKVLETCAAVTGPGAPHRVDARGAVLVDLLIDPESDDYDRMAACFPRETPVAALPEAVGRPLCDEVRGMLARGAPGASVWDHVISRLARAPGGARRIDRRVRSTARYLKEHFRRGWRVDDLAVRVGLSEGRLRHLFRQEMGVSLQAYVTWLRLRDVVYGVAAGHSLTRAAHDSGFADLPHLTRTFRATFGEPPSILLPRNGAPVLTFDASRARVSSAHADTDSERIGLVVRHATGRSDRIAV